MATISAVVSCLVVGAGTWLSPSTRETGCLDYSVMSGDRVAMPDFSMRFAVVGDVVFACVGEGLDVYDISRAGPPAFLGRCELPAEGSNPSQTVGASESIALVGRASGGFAVVDVSNPSQPAFVSGPYSGWGTPVAYIVLESVAFIATPARFIVLDLSDPANLTELGRIDLGNNSFADMAIVGDRIVVTQSGFDFTGIRILDVSNPAIPVVIGEAPTATHLHSLAVAHNRAYVTTYVSGISRLDAYDISDPQAIVPTGSYDPVRQFIEVHALDERVYLTCLAPQLLVLDASTDALVELPPLSMIGRVHEVHSAGDRLVFSASAPSSLGVIDPKNPWDAPLIALDWASSSLTRVVAHGEVAFAMPTSSSQGIRVIATSDPARPQLLGTIPAPFAKQAVTYGEGRLTIFGAQIWTYDVSNPEAPLFLGSWDPPFANALSAVMNGAVAFVGTDEGLYILDMTFPEAPAQLAALYTNPTLDVNGYDVELFDDVLAMACGVWGTRLLDVTDPSAPIFRGLAYTPGGNAQGVDFVGDHLFVANGAPGLSIFDTAELSSPILLTNFPISDLPFRVEVHAGIAYVSRNDSWQGLVLVDVTRPDVPQVIAHGGELAEYCSDLVVHGGLVLLVGNGQLRICRPPCALPPTSVPGLAGSFAAIGLQCAPNPAGRSGSRIRFSLERGAPVDLAVFDVAGRRLRTLDSGTRAAGSHAFEWDTRDAAGRVLAPGVYFIRLETHGAPPASEKVVVVR